MTRTIIEVNVFWNSMGDRECWSYHAHDDSGLVESGNLDLVADDDLDGAIDEACRILDLDITHDDFGREPHRDGGCGTWTAE